MKQHGRMKGQGERMAYRKKSGKRYSYAMCLAVSILIAGMGYGTTAFCAPYFSRQQPETKAAAAITAEESAEGQEGGPQAIKPQPDNIQSESTLPGNTQPETAQSGKVQPGKPQPEKSEPEQPQEAEEQASAGQRSGEARTSAYFDDALFIGDSRTVGLSEYGDLGQAELFADSGMTVFRAAKDRIRLTGGEKKTLTELLEERQFGKIYLMLGVNELGYPYESIVREYTALVEQIRRTQPEALLFLEANLHVTGKKSQASDTYNNANIDRINAMEESMADGEHIFYIDINEKFDDAEGNLAETYTADDSHVLGKYYESWVEWLLQKAI